MNQSRGDVYGRVDFGHDRSIEAVNAATARREQRQFRRRREHAMPVIGTFVLADAVACSAEGCWNDRAPDSDRCVEHGHVPGIER